MKRLLILLMAAMFLVACGNKVGNKDKDVSQEELHESQENGEVIENEKPADQQEEVSGEGIHRVTNIDLDEFIESFNGMATDGGFEQFKRDGNESITADGLLISMNEDGTIWGIVQPIQPTAFSIVATLLSIKKQSNEEDAEKIDVFLDLFANAMDEKEEFFIDKVNIESMEINVSAINGEVLLFNVLGNEQP